MEIPQLPVEQLSWLWINMQVMHSIIKIVLSPCIYRIRLEKEAKLRRSQIWFHNRSRETTVKVKKSGHSVTTCAKWSTVSADGEAEGNFSLIYSVFFFYQDPVDFDIIWRMSSEENEQVFLDNDYEGLVACKRAVTINYSFFGNHGNTTQNDSSQQLEENECQ